MQVSLRLSPAPFVGRTFVGLVLAARLVRQTDRQVLLLKLCLRLPRALPRSLNSAALKECQKEFVLLVQAHQAKCVKSWLLYVS